MHGAEGSAETTVNATSDDVARSRHIAATGQRSTMSCRIPVLPVSCSLYKRLSAPTRTCIRCLPRQEEVILSKLETTSHAAMLTREYVC